MAGNSVILKPSSESVLTGYCLAQQFWAAGVPRDVLQFLPIGDRAAGKALIVDPRTAAVILTGSFETARRFQSWRPDLSLHAETSGKNSMIITVHADLDLAIKDLVRGAFGHSGQKCSATSLALVEKSVYESPKFRQQLKDAAGSLIGDGAWNASAVVTPMIREPDEPLRRGLCTLEDGESWLLKPRTVKDNPCLWRPGIKLGVRPGSWYHRTECFGPILGLMCVDSFTEALEIQNNNEFGLTGGLQSLDPKEISIWREKVEVGNAYINRGMTGAIVRRQPFGGWKHSCVGPGAKAGGPNYVATLGRWTQTEPPKFRLPLTGDFAALVTKLEAWLDDDADRQWLRHSAESYHYWWTQYFSLEHDPSQVHGETNHFRYRPRPWHLLRIGDLHPDRPQAMEYSPKLQIAQTECACRLLGVRLSISLASEPDWRLDFRRITNTDIFVETHEQLIARLHRLRDGTLRVLDRSAHQILSPLDIGNLFVYATPSLANGRLELLSYYREQSISETIHRYGNDVVAAARECLVIGTG